MIVKIMEKWGQGVDAVFKVIGKIRDAICWFFYALLNPFYRNLHPTVCKIIDFTNGKKTYIVSILGIWTLLYSYHKHVVDLQNVVTNLPMLFLAMTFRHGMARHMIPKLEGGDEEDYQPKPAAVVTPPAPVIVPLPIAPDSSSSATPATDSSSSASPQIVAVTTIPVVTVEPAASSSSSSSSSVSLEKAKKKRHKIKSKAKRL